MSYTRDVLPSPQCVAAIAGRKGISTSMPHETPIICPLEAPFIANQALVLQLYPYRWVMQRNQP